ncbi:MAG: UDP-N-acetylmuramate--L-alanine ligase, partial [Chitinophagaceae bacterium]
GYDKTPTALTKALEAEGIKVHFEDAVSNIDQEVLEDKEGSLIVLTPAIPAAHKEWVYLKENGYTILKRSQVLGLITADHYTIAVAGTHGKTTTSSMVAWFLHHAGLNCTAFLGGISANFNSNLLLAAKPEKQVIVVEADEYDRSFLTLFPDVAVITSTDPDHLDIYGQHDELKKTFAQFAGQIKPNGHLFRHESLDPELKAVNTLTYSLEKGDIKSVSTRAENGAFRFDVESPMGNITDLELAVPGFHNVENALAAIGIAQLLGLSEEQIRNAVASYRGVKRRFEYIVRSENTVYIDDYAHHPTEIEAFLKSVRALYPDRRILAIFQPHLFTRTRDFAEGFAESLSLADEVILLDIYPAREEPLTAVSSEMILNNVNVDKKMLITKGEVLGVLEKMLKLDVICTIGAGDIDTLVAPIAQLINNKTS